jgi:hypoxanthine phosphoribosyltransferase
MAAETKHFRITYNQVHNLIKRTAKEIAEFKPDVLLAIGNISNL